MLAPDNLKPFDEFLAKKLPDGHSRAADAGAEAQAQGGGTDERERVGEESTPN